MCGNVAESTLAVSTARPTLKGHLQILRVDHWFKNVFVLPGIVVAVAVYPAAATPELIGRIVLGLFATCLVASSNYVLNEILDAPFDKFHRVKCFRPVPSGRVNIPLAYVQWIVLMMAGIGLGWLVDLAVAASLAALWVMGCAYNIPPIRTKDVPYLDVISESINNPIRMLIGWFTVGTGLIPSVSLLMSYWLVGCYFMAMKRFAEYRFLRDRPEWLYLGNGVAHKAAEYRKSFGYYTESMLLVAVAFYAAAAMLFFGAFLMRYRMELVLAFPFIALVMAAYLALGLKEDSPVQNPEKLYKYPRLVIPLVVCTVVITLLLFIDIPLLHEMFRPTLPIGTG